MARIREATAPITSVFHITKDLASQRLSEEVAH